MGKHGSGTTEYSLTRDVIIITKELNVRLSFIPARVIYGIKRVLLKPYTP